MGIHGTRPILLSLLALLLANCGGGGGGGANSGSTNLTVSGTVRAPAGLVAFDSAPPATAEIAALLLPDAHAAGVTPNVADGTRVELARIDGTGQVVSSLAQTTTSEGRYSFNLTALGIGLASDLLVRARNETTGAQLRAIATSTIVDVSPSSEAALQLLFEKLQSTNAPIISITPQEGTDWQQYVDAVSANVTSTGQDIAQSVDAVKQAASENSALQTFLSGLTALGQTNADAGDIADYYPLRDVTARRYVNINVQGGPEFLDPETHMLGEKNLGGIRALESVTKGGDKQYLTKDASGVYLVATAEAGGSVALLSKSVPILKFPLRKNTSTLLFDESSSIDDLDQDGVLENRRLRADAQIGSVETLTIAGKQLPHCLRVTTIVTDRITLSRTKEIATQTLEDVSWYAPGIGLVRESATQTEVLGRQTSSQSHSIELGGVGFFSEIALSPYDLLYDPLRKRFYGVLPANLRSTQPALVVINPDTGQIERTVPVLAGSPRRMALSADAGFLYLGVHGAEGYVQKYDLNNLSLLSQFAIGRDGGSRPYLPELIAVSPQDPDLVAVSGRSAAGGLGGEVFKLFVNGQPTIGGGDAAPRDALFTPDGSAVVRILGLFPSPIISVSDIYLPGSLGRTVSPSGSSTYFAVNNGEPNNSAFIRNGRLHHVSAGSIDLATRVSKSLQTSTDPLSFSDNVRALNSPDVGRDAFFLLARNQLRYFDGASEAEIGAPIDLAPLGWRDSAQAIPGELPPMRMVRYGSDSLAIVGFDNKIKLARVPLWAEGEVTIPSVPPAAFKAQASLLSLPLPINFLLPDQNAGLLYASLRTPFGSAGQIAVIDPAVPRLMRTISVSSMTNVLAQSADGALLYAQLPNERIVQRIELQTGTATLRIPVGDAACPDRTVYDIAVLPGNAQSIAVTTNPAIPTPCTPQDSRIEIFDNAVRRLSTVAFPIGSRNMDLYVEFGASASQLFASDGVELKELAIDPAGVHEVSSTSYGGFVQNPVYFEGNLLFASGLRLDATTKNRVSDIRGMLAVGIDRTNRELYYGTHSGTTTEPEIIVFASDGTTIVDELTMPVNGTINKLNGQFVATGDKRFGYAFETTSGNEIYFLKRLK